MYSSVRVTSSFGAQSPALHKPFSPQSRPQAAQLHSSLSCTSIGLHRGFMPQLIGGGAPLPHSRGGTPPLLDEPDPLLPVEPDALLLVEPVELEPELPLPVDPAPHAHEPTPAGDHRPGSLVARAPVA